MERGAHGIGDVLHEGEPQSETCALSTCTGLVAAVERFDETGSFLGTERCPAVCDLDPRTALSGAGGDLNRAAVLVVADGVVDEIVDCERQQRRVSGANGEVW